MSELGGYASTSDRWRSRLRRALAAVGMAMTLALGAACANESDAGADGPGASAGPVANEDHWHAAFGAYICDEFLPAIAEFESPVGIHTHGDGVIHIHPFTADGAGNNATLEVYLEGAGIAVSDHELTVGGETYTEGEDTCRGNEGEIVLVRWTDVNATDAGPERVGRDVRFSEDGEGYVVAFIPEGTDIPKPESAAQLDELGVVDGGASTTITTSQDAASGEETPTTAPDGHLMADGFHPVEDTEPAPCRTAGMRPNTANETCYLLANEPALGSGIIEEAEASVSTIGDWEVTLTLTSDGIRAFNDIAALCYQQGPTCPLGQLALVVDSEIVMAPTISEASFERDEIVVSGDFTENQARSIADALTP